jgi:hypothetical protein
MTDKNTEELIQMGIKLLDDSLAHFMEIKGCEKGSALANIIHGALVLAQTIYAVKK